MRGRVNPQGQGWLNPAGRKGRLPGVRAPRQPRRGNFGAPSPVPWDSSAEGTTQALGLRKANALAGLAGDQGYEEQQMGFGTGANNPYSQSAELGRQRDIGNRGALNGAGNQLYAGSTVNRVRGVAASYDRNLTALKAQYARNQELRRQRAQEAEADYTTGAAEAQEGAADRAVESTPEPVGPGAPNKRRRRRGRGR